MVLLLLRVQMLALFVTRVGFLLCVLCCLLAFFLFCFVCSYIACCDVHLRLLSLLFPGFRLLPSPCLILFPFPCFPSALCLLCCLFLCLLLLLWYTALLTLLVLFACQVNTDLTNTRTALSTAALLRLLPMFLQGTGACTGAASGVL